MRTGFFVAEKCELRHRFVKNEGRRLYKSLIFMYNIKWESRNIYAIKEGNEYSEKDFDDLSDADDHELLFFSHGAGNGCAG